MKIAKNRINRTIRKILKSINKKGYVAYIVGGYIRDLLLDKNSYDVDICTNALPSEIMQIFKKYNLKENYGSINFDIKKYNIDITTFRKEIEYSKRKPIKIEYINSLEEDSLRRDFTINSICVDRFGNIIDNHNGINDLNNKIIKFIGDRDKKLSEDPLRILRAIRFATVLDFELDSDLSKSIKKHFELVSSLSFYRIREELSKILSNSNFNKGLELLKSYKILEILNINYNKMYFSNDIYEMWAQLEFEHNFGFTKKELNNIINIRKKLMEMDDCNE